MLKSFPVASADKRLKEEQEAEGMGREREKEGEGCVTGEALTRNSFVNPEGARRLIHWHCSRDPPPRMQTQSLQRVTREMIDEGIGEKVAQS